MAMRTCEICGETDDGPMHVLGTTDGTQGFNRHFRCCARTGCPDGSCNAIVAEAGSGSARPDVQQQAP